MYKVGDYIKDTKGNTGHIIDILEINNTKNLDNIPDKAYIVEYFEHKTLYIDDIEKKVD